MANKAVNKKKKGMSGEDLAGMHIYKDDHNRYVYYNVFDHVGYILNDIPKYKTYSSRFIVGLIGGILAYSFDLHYHRCCGLRTDGGKIPFVPEKADADTEFQAEGTPAETVDCRK